MPTVEQMSTAVCVCQWLSNCYLDIHLFRYDATRKEIYILAGQTIGVTIYPNGLWEFENDA